MNRSLLICACLILSAGYALASEPKTVTIPLDQIWAWEMPGTRDIGQLEPNKPAKVECGPLVGEIRQALSASRVRGTEPRAGFAVVGTGLDALREAHAVLVEKKQPRDSFPVGSEITVVFFSYQAGSYVHLRHVEQRGNVVEIEYRFVPHETCEVTEHLALVPLGKLPVGDVSVRIVLSPIGEPSLGPDFLRECIEWGRRVVCRPFSFSVLADKSE